MMRDDSTGGWVPVGGGGLSNVSVQKQKIFHEDEDQLCKHEYLIDGKRISDQAVSWISIRHGVFLGFSSFAQNQNFSLKFWAKTQNTQNFKICRI